MKISYLCLSGSTSTAYLDEAPDEDQLDQLAGLDKYTDEPVTVAWDSETRRWREVRQP
ncbi:hypothetical protein [Streptomyces sp. NPDC085596]|uniref:hypothetical protein n=1 Tax=Streptomyces sp. NPDC085596 TaxID=3365731 RepID=UPI0037CE9A57